MTEPSIKQVDEFTVAFKVMRGDFALIPQGFGELYGWIEQSGLQPTGMPQAVYLTMPGATPETQAEWELWAPVASGADQAGPDENGLGVKQVAPSTMAFAMHVGPYDSVAPTYEELGRWVADHGYVVVGPPRELYYSDPDEVPPSEYLTEVQMPVAPA